MKKKIILTAIAITVCIFCALGLVACDETVNQVPKEKSPYEVWIDVGYSGTEDDFLS